MECNRDEAKRAKGIAESKLSTKDIMGAKKFALKAQSLYPGLDGLPQLLAVLDVYVAAENKINGQLDFYGILGVSPSADDDSVKKHYRKLALSLHPDKNKSIGAEGAFQYISLAWNFLSDKEKRSTYDKRNSRVFKQKMKAQNGGARASHSQPPTQNGFYNFMNSTAPQTTTPTQAKVSTTKAKDTTKSPKDNANANANVTFKTVSTSVPLSSDNQMAVAKTFWTVCKRCKLQYEFVRMYLNRNLLCPTCHGPFLATETPPPNTDGNCSEALKKAQGANKNVTSHGDSSNHTTSSQWGPFSRKTSSRATVAQAASMVQQAYERVKRDREEAQAATKREEAKRRKVSKKATKLSSSRHMNSVKTNKDFDGYRTKEESGQVEAKKDVSNTGIKNRLMKKATLEIRKKLNEWSSETVKDSMMEVENGDDVGEKGKGKIEVDDSVNGDVEKHQSEALVRDVPEADFHDFDHDRSEKCFEGGQVWAAYDDHDGMPRSYAIVHNVISSDPFKMKVCWLKPKPNNRSEAFGEFKAGKQEIVSVPNYFSHKANFKKQASGNIRVFPKKGDVCALHKNNNKNDDRYEIVEVEEEYDEESGITVTPLVKVGGFKTVFQRHLDPKETRVIPENEMFLFSHQIPWCLVTGPMAPKGGCLELDPAAIPPEFLQVTVDECSKY